MQTGRRLDTAVKRAPPQTRIAGVSPTVFLLGLVSLCNDLASEMIYPLLPVFLTSIGASFTFIGLLEGLAETTASLLKLCSGWIADRLGRRRLLTVAGYTFSNVLRPLLGLATTGWHALLLRFADRVGKGVRTAPRDAMIADNTVPEERGRAFGFNRSMDHAGAMLGSLAAFLLLSSGSVTVPAVFLLSAIPGLLALVFLLVGIGIGRDTTAAVATAPTLSLAPFDRRFRLFLLILAVFALGNSSDAFLLLRAHETGIPVSSLPLLWIVFHAVKSLSSMPGGALSDRVGRTHLIVAGWAVYAVVYLGFSVASAEAHIWLLFAAYGLYYGLTEGVEKAFVADLVPAHLRATAFGMYHFTVGIMSLPASLLCGFLWQRVSSHAALSTGALLAAAASLLLVALVRIDAGTSRVVEVAPSTRDLTGPARHCSAESRARRESPKKSKSER
jgi:MFS family permease